MSSRRGVTLSARPRRSFFSASSQHARDSWTYAPRPFFLPVGSSSTRPSGVRTMRTSPRFASVLRHAMHVRRGTCFGRAAFATGILPDQIRVLVVLILFLGDDPASAATLLLLVERGDTRGLFLVGALASGRSATLL